MFKRKNVRRLAFAIMLAAACIFAGCGSKSDKETAAVQTAEPTSTPEAEEIKTIGNVYAVLLKNETGRDITGVSIRSDAEDAFPDNLLPDEDVFINGETRLLYCVRADADAKLLPVAYDVQMTFSDGTVPVLHSFPFSDVKEAKLLYEENVLYIVYESISSGETASTKEAELAVKAAEEAAAAQAEADRKAAEEQAAAEQKAAEEAAAQAEAEQKAAAEEAARQAAEEAAAQEAAAAEAQRAAEEAAAAEAQRAAEEAAAAEAQEGDSESCIGDEGMFY